LKISVTAKVKSSCLYFIMYGTQHEWL